MIRKLLLIAILLFATGCATMVNGRYQTITVDSYPSGAAIAVDCGDAPADGGVTPASIRVERAAEQCTFTLTRDGYAPRLVTLEHQVSRASAMNVVFAVPGAIVFGLVGAILGSIVDGADSGIEVGIEVGAAVGSGVAGAADRSAGGLKWVPEKVHAILVRPDPEESPNEAPNDDPPGR